MFDAASVLKTKPLRLLLPKELNCLLAFDSELVGRIIHNLWNLGLDRITETPKQSSIWSEVITFGQKILFHQKLRLEISLMLAFDTAVTREDISEKQYLSRKMSKSGATVKRWNTILSFAVAPKLELFNEIRYFSKKYIYFKKLGYKYRSFKLF